jgi:non-specific serine/threonine protein kinase
MACSSSGTEKRLIRYAQDEAGIVALKHAVVISSLLTAELGPRQDILQITGKELNTGPFHTAYEHDGQVLDAWALEHLSGLAQDERLALFRQLTQTVSDLHSIGVLQNDIRPGNILIAGGPDQWQLRFISFDRCQLVEPERLKLNGVDTLGLTPAQITGDGISFGTGPQVAPELRSGTPATQRSDVYALGVLLYQLLSGDLRKVALGPGWERDIEEQLLRTDIACATDVNSAFRTSSVAALIQGLESLESRRANQVLETRAQEEMQKASIPRHQARAGVLRTWAMAGLILLLLGSAVAVVHSYRSGMASKREAEHQEVFNRDVPALVTPTVPGVIKAVAATDALRTAEQSAAQIKDPVAKAAQLLTLADAHYGLSEYVRAAELQDQAANLFASSRGANDAESLEAEYLRVRTLLMLSRYKEADDLLRQTDSRAATSIHGATRLAMVALWARAGEALIQSHPEQALPLYLQSEQIRTKVASADPVWLFRLHAALASCYVRMNRNQDAVVMLEHLVGSPYAPDSVSTLDWLRTRLQYGLALGNLARFAQAEQVLRDAAGDVARELGAKNYLTGLTWNHLANIYEHQGQFEEAKKAEQFAYPIMAATVGPRGQQALIVAGNLAALEYLSGNAPGAVEKLRAVRSDVVAVSGSQAPLLQLLDYYLAASLHETGKAEEAWALAAALQPEALTAADAGGHWEGRLQGLKGLILVNRGQKVLGRYLLGKAIATLRREHAPQWMVAQLQPGAVGGRPRSKRG